MTKLTMPTRLNSSATREIDRRQCALAILGAIATIGAPCAAVRMNAKSAAWYPQTGVLPNPSVKRIANPDDPEHRQDGKDYRRDAERGAAQPSLVEEVVLDGLGRRQRTVTVM